LKYLGLDLGTRTLGVSISDLTHTIATTYKTIRYEEEDYQYLLTELNQF
jgi:RNase H-fold protein (predicted Holliday junction resolvase)